MPQCEARITYYVQASQVEGEEWTCSLPRHAAESNHIALVDPPTCECDSCRRRYQLADDFIIEWGDNGAIWATFDNNEEDRIHGEPLFFVSQQLLTRSDARPIITKPDRRTTKAGRLP